MAHKKGVGSSKNGRDSESNRLGVKVFGGQHARAGNIIVRQRGTRFHPGNGVGIGKDHTIFATVDGTVVFRKKKNNRTYIHVAPQGGTETLQAAEAATDTAVPQPTPAEEVTAAAAEDISTAATGGEGSEEIAPAIEKAASNDDLKKIEGIGPKTAEILVNGGLDSFESLGNATPDQVREILVAAGNRYAAFDPETWPAQARLAAEGKWDELKSLQDELKGGKA